MLSLTLLVRTFFHCCLDPRTIDEQLEIEVPQATQGAPKAQRFPLPRGITPPPFQEMRYPVVIPDRPDIDFGHHEQRQRQAVPTFGLGREYTPPPLRMVRTAAPIARRARDAEPDGFPGNGPAAEPRHLFPRSPSSRRRYMTPPPVEYTEEEIRRRRMMPSGNLIALRRANAAAAVPLRVRRMSSASTDGGSACWTEPETTIVSL
jgi:hypothetical protein